MTTSTKDDNHDQASAAATKAPAGSLLAGSWLADCLFLSSESFFSVRQARVWPGTTHTQAPGDNQQLISSHQMTHS